MARGALPEHLVAMVKECLWELVEDSNGMLSLALRSTLELVLHPQNSIADGAARRGGVSLSRQVRRGKAPTRILALVGCRTARSKLVDVCPWRGGSY